MKASELNDPITVRLLGPVRMLSFIVSREVVATIEALLLELLCRLEILGDTHEELYDSEAREQIGSRTFQSYGPW